MFKRVLLLVLINLTVAAQLSAQNPPYQIYGEIHAYDWCGTGYNDIQFEDGNGHANTDGTESLLCHYTNPKTGFIGWRVYYDGDIASPTVGMSYEDSYGYRVTSTREASYGTSDGLQVTGIQKTYALQLTGYADQRDVLCEGRSIRLTTSGARNNIGWDTHLEVKFEDDDDDEFQPCSYSHSANVMTIYASSISSALDSNYTNKDINFKLIWRKNSSTSSDILGEHIYENYSVRYLDKINGEFTTVNPTCNGELGSASMTITDLPTGSNQLIDGNRVACLYTIHHVIEALSSYTGEKFYYDGNYYRRSGNGITDDDFLVITSDGDAPVDLGNQPGGVYLATIYLQVESNGEVQNLYPSHIFFEIVEPDPIGIIIDENSVCSFPPNSEYNIPLGATEAEDVFRVRGTGGSGNYVGTIQWPFGNITHSLPLNTWQGWNSMNPNSFGTVRVQEENDANCYAEGVISFKMPPPIRIDTTILEPTCPINSESGNTTGAVEITISGGCGSWQYRTEHMQYFFPVINGTVSMDGVTPGEHTVEFDDYTHRPEFTFIMPSPDSLNVDYTLTKPKCHISNIDQPTDGDAIIQFNDIAGFNNSDTYISYGDSDSTNYPGDVVNLNLEPSTDYTIRIMDDNLCSMTFDTRTLDSPDPITLTDHVTNSPRCINGDDGNTELHIEGGTPDNNNYDVRFGSNPREPVSSIIEQNLMAQPYVISIIDSLGCSLETSHTIPHNDNPISITSIASTDQVCDSVENGTISATASPSFYHSDLYQWHLLDSDSSLLSESTTPNVNTNLNNLSSGEYIVVIEDGSSCFASEHINIGLNNSQFDFNGLPTTNNTMCEGVSTGSLAFTVTNAESGLLNYSFSGPDSSAVVQSMNTNYEFTNLAEGTYRIRAEDDLGCIIHNTVEISANPNPVKFSSINIDPKYCDYVPGGTIEITTEHDQGHSIERIWMPAVPGYDVASNEATFENLGTASDTTNWQVYARGTFGCVNDTLVSIPNLKNHPTIDTISFDSLACTGNQHGAIEITGLQDLYAGPYNFVIDGDTLLGDTVQFENLSGRQYMVSISDTIGCSGNLLFSVPVIKYPFRISDSIITPPSCVRAGNGTITLTGQGGVPSDYGYTFYYNDTNSLQGYEVTFENLPAFSHYSYRAVDSEGCEHAGPLHQYLQVNYDSLDLMVHEITDASCPERADGNVNLQTRFGNWFMDGYHYSVYSLDPENLEYQFSANAIPTAGNLAPGSYRIEVEDEDNCLSAETVEIGAPNPVTLDVNPGFVARKDDETGWADAIADSGNHMYDIEWYSGTEAEDANLLLSERIDATSGIAGLAAGNYLVRVADTAGCQFWDGNIWLEESISIAEPEEDLVITKVDSTNISCYGRADGSVEVNASGGWGNEYRFGLDKTSLLSAFQIHELDTGMHWVYVQDTSGVFDSLSVRIVQPDTLISTITATKDLLCFEGTDGTVTLSIEGGTQPYVIPEFITNWIEENHIVEIQDLKGDTLYTLRVEDAHGCTTDTTTMLSQPEKGMEIAEETITDTECGAEEGVIEINVEGGTPGYSYYWTNEEGVEIEGNESIDGLVRGEYNLLVTDNNDCSQPFSFYVADSTSLDVQNWIIQAVNCWGDANGRASMEVIEGFPPYVVTWPGNTHGEWVENLEAGDYYVDVEDSEGCGDRWDFTIPTPDSVSIGTLVREDPLCFGVDDGSIEVEAAGGTPNYDYLWSTGREQADIRNLEKGTYNLTITDAHGCFKTYSFNMEHQTEVETALTDSVSICYGNEFPLDPGEFLFYQWSNGDEIISEEQVLKVTDPDIYKVEVEDMYGCIGFDSTEIHLSETEFVAQALMASEIYLEDTVAIFETSRTVPDSMEIYFSDGLEVIEQGSHYCYVTPSDTGMYTITIIAHREDCIDIQVKEVRVLPGSSDDSMEKFAANSLIQSFTLFPNPTDGNFRVTVDLGYEADATLRLLSHSGTGIIDQKNLYKSDYYDVEYNLTGIQSDVYVLFLEVEDEVRSIKFIIL